MHLALRRSAAAFAVAAFAFATSATPAGAADAAGCDQVASPTGTISTPQQLLNALQPGQVGCFREGTYTNPFVDQVDNTHDGNELNVTKSVTLQSYPDERATLKGRIIVTAANVKIRRLNLDGVGAPPCCSSVTVNGADAQILGNEITNPAGICITVVPYLSAVPDRAQIRRNRIHDCKPANNHNQGVYVSYGNGVKVVDNLIYDNGDRGLQFYPDANGGFASNNTFARNRTNVSFGSGEGVSHGSSDNTVSNNILATPITTSTVWGVGFNADAVWDAAQGSNNQVLNNCAWTTSGTSGIPSRSGMSSSGTVVADPVFRNTTYGDYSVRGSNPCAGKSAPDHVVSPNFDGPVSLTRYWNGSVHWVTSGAPVLNGSPVSGFVAEKTLGFLQRTPDVSGTVALYSCKNAGDYFLSKRDDCEGFQRLATVGYIYSSQPSSPATTPIYRCYSGVDHFASWQSNCEGRTTEELLGYARSTVPLRRYFYGGPGIAQDHWITTGLMAKPYAFETTLGSLRNSDSGTHPIYNCLIGGFNGDFQGRDHMLSLQSNCEQGYIWPLGVEGFAYDTQQPNTQAIYRCFNGTTDHWASFDPNCEGYTTEMRLGYV